MNSAAFLIPLQRALGFLGSASVSLAGVSLPAVPKQPTGLEPVKFIRDEALTSERPGVAFVDITGTYLEIVKHKDYLALSGNGANHPNDFLHRFYAQRILEVLIP